MWRTAIENHKKLSLARPDPTHWSDNIIDATNILTDNQDWAVFYAYLTQAPRFFNIDSPVIGPTLGELEQIPGIPAYGPNQTLEVYKNGTEPPSVAA